MLTTLSQWLAAQWIAWQSTTTNRDERGLSQTTEMALLVVGGIAVAGGLVWAIKAFIDSTTASVLP
jgi:hypothetical protein